MGGNILNPSLFFIGLYSKSLPSLCFHEAERRGSPERLPPQCHLQLQLRGERVAGHGGQQQRSPPTVTAFALRAGVGSAVVRLRRGEYVLNSNIDYREMF